MRLHDERQAYLAALRDRTDNRGAIEAMGAELKAQGTDGKKNDTHRMCMYVCTHSQTPTHTYILAPPHQVP